MAVVVSGKNVKLNMYQAITSALDNTLETDPTAGNLISIPLSKSSIGRT